MIKVENYPNAYREVYEILKLVPKEDLNKIPAEFLQIVKKNMNKNYDFSINLDIDFVKEQEILYETKVILAYVFLNYWATEDEKRIIRAKFKKDILEKDTPLLFKVSNHVFGISFIIMDIFIFYVNRWSLVAYVKGT